MATECAVESKTCTTEADEGRVCPTESPCRACGTACGGDPYACAAAMWECSFFQALKGVQVDFLKEKIRKTLGAKMDKAADAIVESMGARWQSMLTQAKAKEEFQERLRSLWQEGQT